uniref:Uncharacterized protein n=1 Tax=Helianthus annuus TaxID=4232 RepID=A0A251UWE0_HELAN
MNGNFTVAVMWCLTYTNKENKENTMSWTRLDLAYGTYGILLGNCESLRWALL